MKSHHLSMVNDERSEKGYTEFFCWSSNPDILRNMWDADRLQPNSRQPGMPDNGLGEFLKNVGISCQTPAVRVY